MKLSSRDQRFVVWHLARSNRNFISMELLQILLKYMGSTKALVLFPELCSEVSLLRVPYSQKKGEST